MENERNNSDEAEIKCLFCMKNEKDGEDHVITDEHIIPESLGGWIEIPFVCRKCNNEYLGSKLESELKENAYIVMAIEKLGIQNRNKAFRSADLKLHIDETKSLIGNFNEKGEFGFFPQEIDDGSMVVPEKDTKTVLKKQIERYEKRTGKKVDFNVDGVDSLPFDIYIPIMGTNIAIIKRRGGEASIRIHGLDKPISFRIPAKIALEHLAGLYYPFAMKREFDRIRKWIISGGANKYVLINTPLSKIDPSDAEYLPYHFVRFGLKEGGFSALVGLFGLIKFMVFLGKIDNLKDFPAPDCFDYYHVYGINEREVFKLEGEDELRREDENLLRAASLSGIDAENADDNDRPHF